MKTRWYKDAVIYQIYPRSFNDSNGDGIGDINGIIEKLDYLKDLGIDCVWLSPCYKSPNDDNGYDISDYRDIMTDFGTLDDWKRMIAGMHERGIKLVMDLVVNHSSDEHEWFKHSRTSLDDPYRDYYIWRKGRGRNGKKPPNNWRSNFLGSAWQYDNRTNEFYLHLFSKKQPDLNWDNPKVRQEVIDICNYWLELGVDGFRCDVITFISKKTGLPNGKPSVFTGHEHYVLGEHWNEYINEINKNSWAQYDTLIVGECAMINDKQTVAITDENNALLDTSFTFEHVYLDVMNKCALRKLKAVWRKYQTVPSTCWTSNYLENHDQSRCIPRYAPGGVWRKKSAKLLAIMNFFMRGTPYIYQGQEIGMTNCEFGINDYKDIMSINILKTAGKFGLKRFAHKKLLRSARDHARTPFQWNNRTNAGFSTGKPWMMINPNYKEINLESDLASSDSVYKFYQNLIKRRRNVNYIIKDGEFGEYYTDSNNIYVFSRTLGNETLYIVLNFTTKPQIVAKPNAIPDGKVELIISNDDTLSSASNVIATTLQPLAGAVYKCSKG